MSMLRKIVGHSEMLEDVLSDLVLHGAVVVPYQHLMRWTNTQRVTFNMWKYVDALFQEVLQLKGQHEHGYQLFIGENAESYTFLIWDRGEGKTAPDPWWKPIEFLKQPKVRRLKADEQNEAEAA